VRCLVEEAKLGRADCAVGGDEAGGDGGVVGRNIGPTFAPRGKLPGTWAFADITRPLPPCGVSNGDEQFNSTRGFLYIFTAMKFWGEYNQDGRNQLCNAVNNYRACGVTRLSTCADSLHKDSRNIQWAPEATRDPSFKINDTPRYRTCLHCTEPELLISPLQAKQTPLSSHH
jgi:hypothetical protein